MTMFWGLSYNIVTTVNNTILYTWKRLNGWILKVFSTPKNCNYMRWCVNLPHCSNYFTLSVRLLSCVLLFVTPWTAAHQTSLPLTISQNLPKFMFIASVMLCSHLILWCSLLLPSIFASIRDFFQWVGCSHQVTTEYRLLLLLSRFSRVQLCATHRRQLVFSYSFPLYGKILLCSRYLLFSDRISRESHVF